MAITPKNFKYKKYFKGKIRTVDKNKKLKNTGFGDYVLIAAEPARLTIKQVESARKIIKKIIKPFGGIVRVKPRAYLPVTEKAVASRMGRGRGKVSQNIIPVRKGNILFELYCSDLKTALLGARQGAFRLPLKTLVIKKLI